MRSAGLLLRDKAVRDLAGAGVLHTMTDRTVITGLPLDGALMVTPRKDSHTYGDFAEKRSGLDVRWMALMQERPSNSALAHYWVGMPFRDLVYILGEIAEERRRREGQAHALHVQQRRDRGHGRQGA